jgi:antitoxin (DNA-binding transcriptional repressor) of toxin-antitoxin stability system
MKQRAISVATFKATCLEVLRGLESGTYARVIVTRRGKPIAELIPPRNETPRLWGALRGSVDIAADVDLAEPVLDEPLDAEQGVLNTGRTS